MLFSTSDKRKLFVGTFSKSSNRNESCSSLPTFPSATNLKLKNMLVIPKMFKVSNNCSWFSWFWRLFLLALQWWFQYLRASTFVHISWFFQHVNVVGKFQNVEERYVAKIHHSVSVLSVASKLVDLLTKNLVDHFEK